MGYDEQILVVRQITDEDAWHAALEEIAEAFRGEKGDCEESEQPEELLLDHLESQPEVERLRAQLEDLSAMRRLEVTEELNFGPPGVDISDAYHWESAYFRGPEGTGACFHGPGGAAHFRLDDTKSVAEAAARRSGSAEELPQYAGLCDWSEAHLTAELAKFLYRAQNFQRLSEEIRELFPPAAEVEAADLYPQVPLRFEFRVGERPSLPLFARHFQICTSTVSGDSAAAGPVLRRVYEVLKRHFPEHLVYDTELEDQEVPELLRLPSGDVDGERAQRAQFYEALRAAFPPRSSGAEEEVGEGSAVRALATQLEQMRRELPRRP